MEQEIKILKLQDIKTSLDVYIKTLNLNKLSDDDLKILCFYKLARLDIGRRIRYLFSDFLLISPISRKHMLVAIKNMKGMLFLPYLYRHVLKTAYENEVPKPVINQYVTAKNSYDRWKKSKNNKDSIDKYRDDLNNKFMILYGCTREMVLRNNTRKEKIYKILTRKKDGE